MALQPPQMEWISKQNPFNSETPESWNLPEVQKWKKTAKTILKGYFCEFKGSQFNRYSLDDNRKALTFRILYALFGPPEANLEPSEDYNDYPGVSDAGFHIEYSPVEYVQEDSETKRPAEVKPINYSIDEDDFPEEFNVYSDEKKSFAESIVKLMEQLANGERTVFVGIIFIFCKESANEYSVPIFSMLKKGENPERYSAKRYFIDRDGRAYDGWENWKKNNVMPMLKYAYPKFGYYTTNSYGVYEFDPSKDLTVSIEFGNSPKCSDRSKWFQSADKVSGASALACAAIFGSSFIVPVAPILYSVSTMMGMGCGIYTGFRSADRMFDKRKHREEMKNVETFILMCSILALPLTAVTATASNLLVTAEAESIFSSTNFQTMVTILSYTNFSFDGAMLCMNFANLLERYKKNELTTLDCLHFSMSVYFFSNTLVRPKVAADILAEAQKMTNNKPMTAEQAKATYEEKYVNKNRDRTKIVQNMKNIDNPDQFFGSIGDDVSAIKICGKKNQNILLIKKNGKVQRINPRTFGKQHPEANNMQEFHSFCSSPKRSEADKAGSVAGLGLFVSQFARNSPTIVKICNEILKHFPPQSDCQRYASDLVRIIMDECQKRNSTKVTLGSKALFKDINNYLLQFRRDVLIAKEIADNARLVFENDLKAYTLYKKYGIDYPIRFKSQPIDVYLEHIPSAVDPSTFNKSHEQIEFFNNGIERKVNQTGLGKVTVSLNNFSTIQRYNSQGEQLSSEEKIQRYLQMNRNLTEIFDDLSRQVCDVMGVSSTDPYFYHEIPIRLFLKGSDYGFDSERFIPKPKRPTTFTPRFAFFLIVGLFGFYSVFSKFFHILFSILSLFYGDQTSNAFLLE